MNSRAEKTLSAETLAGVRKTKVNCWPEGATQELWVAEEVPVALCYNGISHVVMMASPAFCEELAIGFSLSEGIVDCMDDIYGVEVADSGQGVEVNLDISARQFKLLKAQRRQLAGRTGCGLCGRESLEAVDLQCPKVEARQTVTHGAIQCALSGLIGKQPVHRTTGGTHAAAWCNAEGGVIHVMEDVGRHNALDKVIGLMAREKQPLSEGFLLISSRASYEIVQKCARLGIACIAAVSAPTSLAIRMAEEAGITLIAFTRSGRHSIFSHPERLRR